MVKFPKRSKSIICSTAYGAASAYGHSVYKIFPFDDTKIGVSPESDIWYTFPQYGTIELFNEGFRKLIESFLDYNFINNIKSYNELLKLCNEIDKVKINYLKNKEPEKMHEKLDGYILVILDDYKYLYSNIKLIDVFNKALNPLNNGFKIKYSKNRIDYNKEVWLDENCLAISNYLFKSIDFRNEFDKRIKS